MLMIVNTLVKYHVQQAASYKSLKQFNCATLRNYFTSNNIASHGGCSKRNNAQCSYPKAVPQSYDPPDRQPYQQSVNGHGQHNILGLSRKCGSLQKNVQS